MESIVDEGREGKGREHPGSNGPLHLLCPCICHSISDGQDNGQGPLGQFHHPLWFTGENPLDQGRNLRVSSQPTSAN